MLIVPAGATIAGACVASGIAVGTAVGAGPPPVDGAVVAGTAVGAAVVAAAAGTEVAVAEDPQANNNATNSRTIALGRCLIILGFDLNLSALPSPWLRCANNNAVYR